VHQRFYSCCVLSKYSQDLKLKYYDLMIQHALHGDGYLDCAKYYHKIWETPSIKKDAEGKGRDVSTMRHFSVSVMLTPMVGPGKHRVLRGPCAARQRAVGHAASDVQRPASGKA
jgi:hypothetical protein